MAKNLRSRRIMRRRRGAAIELLEDRRLLSAAPPGTPNTLTFHGDAVRTGFDQNEAVLSPANVSANFGQMWQSPVLDGHLYASPLYMDNVSITSGGNGVNHSGDGVVAGSGKTLGVVFAATGGGSVFAIKAFDTSGPTGVAAGSVFAGADPVVDDSLLDLVADGTSSYGWEQSLRDLGRHLGVLENHRR